MHTKILFYNNFFVLQTLKYVLAPSVHTSVPVGLHLRLVYIM